MCACPRFFEVAGLVAGFDNSLIVVPVLDFSKKSNFKKLHEHNLVYMHMMSMMKLR